MGNQVSRIGAATLKAKGFLALSAATALLALGFVPASADDAGTYLKSAEQFEMARDFHSAEVQLRNAAQAAPANGAIRLELAKVYLQLHDANAAEAELFAAHMRGIKEEVTAPLAAQAMLDLGEFGDLLKNVPAGNRPAKIESAVRAYRGEAEVALGETNRARAMFADAERLDPKAPLPLIGETRLLIEQRQFDRAMQKIDQALKLDPRNANALDTKGLIFAMRGNTQAATQQFALAIAAAPGDLRPMLDRANLETDRGQLAAAEKDIVAIRKIAPRNVMVFYLQATIDAKQGKYKDADSLLETIRGAMANLPSAYLLAAEVKFRLNQLDQSESFTRKYIAQAPNEGRAWALLGAIARQRGNIEASIAALEKAARLAPKDPNVLAALGQAYIAHGDLNQAKQTFAQAAASAPNNAPLATERALADFATGDRQESVTALSDVFKSGKGNLVAGPPLVIEALQLGQLDVAEATARELVAHDAANPTYQELLAAVRIGQHDYSGAEILLKSVLAKHPDLTSARRDLAQIYVSTNRAAEARRLYQERLTANPKDVDSLEALAAIAVSQHDDAGAINLLERAQAVAPADPQPSLRILAILEVQKKWPEAIARARALAGRFAKSADVADALGHLYFVSGNRQAAAGAFRSAAAKFPASPPILTHYAAVFAAEKNYAAAAPLVMRAAQLDPHNTDLKRFYVTLVYSQKGADAAFAASQVVTSDKNGPAAALICADVLAANNNRAAAIGLLERRQAQNPSTPIVMALAALYQRDNRSEMASSLLRSWTTAHPADVDARFALAQLDSATGKLNEALSQYEWLVAQKPDNPVMLNNLAWLYSWKHDPRARPTAEKAIQLAPASGSVADTLGWIMAGEGDIAGAAKYLAQASASQPSDATIQYHYAVILSKTGKTAQAKDTLQKLLKLNVASDTKSDAQLLLAKLSSGP